MLLAALSAAALSTCPLASAHYTLRGAPGVTAGFVHRTDAADKDWPARIFFRLDAAPGRIFWFLPYDGGSDGRDNLASVTDPRAAGWRPPGPDGGPRPLGDLRWMLMDGNYDMRRNGTDGLGADTPAPAHILILDLSEALWYRTPSDQRLGVPLAFFDMTGCTAVSGG